ncbi:MAG TPA: Calx-beta domain-containing protein, partial [Ilumatobacteraceae bacterium]|nr:Calx-beta domain-containing protein [Ilumatobacteraceae bacterium]
EDFNDGVADWLTDTSGTWSVASARLSGATITLDQATALADLGAPVGYDAYLELEAVVNAATGRAGLVFDYYSDNDFKFVLIDAAADLVLLGHRAGGSWTIDRSATMVLADGIDHVVNITLKGASVNVTVNGSTIFAHGYNSALVDGGFGVLTTGSGTFDNVRVRTNSSNFDEYNPGSVLVSIGDATVTEGDSGTTAVTLTIQLASAATETVTVGWVTTPGTALAPGDYVAASGTVTFNPGEISKQITVYVVGDTVSEPTETFGVALNLVSGPATIDDGLGVITITDNDAVSLPTVSVSATGGAEGGSPVVVTFTRSGSTAGSLTVSATKSGTSGTGDVSGPVVTGGSWNGTSVTFATGSSTVTLAFAIVDDTLVEGTETLVMTINSGAGYAVGSPASATANIADNDSTQPPPPPTAPTLSINSVTVTEGDNGKGTVYATLTVTRSGDTSGSSTVSWATVAGTAVAGSDFQAATGTVTFAAGETTKTIRITIVADKRAEPTETFTVVLSSPISATITVATGTVTIIDNDGALFAASAGSSTSVEPLRQVDAQAMLAAAVQQWVAAGASRDALAGLTIVIGDLPGRKLADTMGSTITIDADAAGWGWNLTPGVPSPGRIDLLSVLLHEVGHVLGFEHTAGGLMAGEIEAGTQLWIGSLSTVGALPAVAMVLTNQTAATVESALGVVERAVGVVEPVAGAAMQTAGAVDGVVDNIVRAAEPAVRSLATSVDVRSLSATSTTTPWNDSFMPTLVVALGLLMVLRRRRLV